MLKYLLGIDIGTSGAKTVLFDTAGRAVARATAEYPLAQPAPGYAEQRPEDWWQAVCVTVRRVLDAGGVNPAAVAAVGLSGQMHGAVLLDENGAVLRPALLWCDQRTERECREITEQVGAERLLVIAANPAITGFTAPKVQWVKNHEPEVFQRIAKVLLPKDYVRYRLTGVYATEVSDASGTLWLDVGRRTWSEEILGRLGLNIGQMPAVYESHVISGTVTAAAAAATGLAAGTPVAGGGGDQAAGAVGNGIVRPGVVSSTIGTSGVVFACLDRKLTDPLGRVHMFCHALPATWHMMGVTQAAGLSLRWLRDTCCEKEKEAAAARGIDPYEVMCELAASAPAGSDGLLFLPYLMGERTPHLDAQARGVFFGITARHGKAELIRAVLEGVTYSLRDCLEIIEAAGVAVGEVRASGGGARSRLWKQIQAGVFGKTVTALNSEEGAARGAAILAGVGAGLYRDALQAVEGMLADGEVYQPESAAVAAYNRCYPLYRELYIVLKDSFRKL